MEGFLSPTLNAQHFLSNHAPKIPPLCLLRCGDLQHCVGSLLSLGSPVVVSLFGLAAAKPSPDFRLPRYGRGPLRHCLFRGSARSRTRLVAGGCRVNRKSTWANRPLPVDLERHLAALDDRVVTHKRSDLVGSFRTLSLRRLAGVSARCVPNHGQQRLWTKCGLSLKFYALGGEGSVYGRSTRHG